MSARVRYLRPQTPPLPPGHRLETPRTARVLLALARVVRAARRAGLRYVTESNGRYIERRAADGIMDSASLRESRKQLAADYVRLALLEDQPMHKPFIPTDSEQPSPAECATHIGADIPGRRVTRSERAACVMVGLVAVIAVLACLAHVFAKVTS